MRRYLFISIFLVLVAAGIYFLVIFFTDFWEKQGQPDVVHGREPVLVTQNDKKISGTDFVYEVGTQKKEDCSKYEQYDPERRICFYECDTLEECNRIAEMIDQEFSKLMEKVSAKKDFINEEVIPSDDVSLKAEYKVFPGEKIVLQKGFDNNIYRQVWRQIARLSPDFLTDKYIESYQVFEDEGEESGAFVEDEDGDGKWRIAINLASYRKNSEQENIFMIIHELAHIISLNPTQVDAHLLEEECPSFFIDEGCAKSNSYLYKFQDRFWSGVKKNDDGSANFHPGYFVTKYASTNEVEDFAESFAFFVLSKDNLMNTSVRNAKINFFYHYPELVDIRKNMRNALSAEILRIIKQK